mgnify:CR=1 FL=1
MRRDKSYEDKCKAADASFAAVSNKVAQLDRENARCVSQAKRALASAGEVARRMARAEAAVAEHQARADRAEAEAAELRASRNGDAERQLKEACRRAEQASSRASSATARAENAEKRAKALEDRLDAAERKAAASREAELAAEKRAEAANEAEATAATKCASLEADLDALRGQAERGQAALMGELDELRAARERAESDAGAVSGTMGQLRKELEAANQRAHQAELAASAADARAAVAAESRVVRVASAQPSSTLPATRGSELLRWRARVALDATGVGVSLKDGEAKGVAPEWSTVIVDDQLPCHGKKKPIFSTNVDPGGGPLAAISKALAKMYGCYEHLNGGRVGSALEDLTGGVSDKIYLRDGILGADGLEKQPQINCTDEMAGGVEGQMWGRLKEIHETGHLLGAAYKPKYVTGKPHPDPVVENAAMA